MFWNNVLILIYNILDPVWLAPEILNEISYDESVDIYAFGIIMWELLERKHPFDEFAFEFQFQLDDAIRSGTRPTFIESGNDSSEICTLYKDLTSRCWSSRAADRPTANIIASSLEQILKLV